MKHVKLKPSDTAIDHRYQRDLDKARAETMAQSFNPALVGVPVVSLRDDGLYYRLDGQHRIAASIIAGHGNVPILMEVHEGLTQQQEAELFLRLNGGRKAVGAIDKFRARLVAQEPVALEIQATLKRLGCKVVKAPARGGVMAVQAAEHAHHRGNLEPTMRALFDWLDGDPAAFDGELIRAVSAFFTEFPEAEPLHLAAKLQAHSVEKLRARLRREFQSASSRTEAARYVISDIYNRGTRQTKRVSRAPEAAVN